VALTAWKIAAFPVAAATVATLAAVEWGHPGQPTALFLKTLLGGPGLSPSMVLLGAVSGTAAGVLAGLIGIGGGIVVVPVIYYGLVALGTSADQAAHIAVATSLAAILPAALVSSFIHWRSGHTDIGFLRNWGPGIVLGVVAAQLAAPFPGRFQQVGEKPRRAGFCHAAGLVIGSFSGLAGVGGGIMTNIIMSLSGLPMHRCVGRAAAVGVVVAAPATLVAAIGPGFGLPFHIGSIDLSALACIAPTQAAGALLGARLARRLAGENLSRIMAAALVATGVVMLRSSLLGH